MNTPPIVVSLGGSVFAPKNGLDVEFFKRLKSLIEHRAAKGERFILITGGGSICREYQRVAREAGSPEELAVHWLGVQITRANAHLLRTILGKLAHPEIATGPKTISNWESVALCAGGSEPGTSTDHSAVQYALAFGATKVINLSNTDYIYDKNPSEFPDARPIKTMTWLEYRAMMGDEWGPGAHAPFDPYASKLSEENGLTVISLNGAKLDEFEKALDGQEFIGSVISASSR